MVDSPRGRGISQVGSQCGSGCRASLLPGTRTLTVMIRECGCLWHVLEGLSCRMQRRPILPEGRLGTGAETAHGRDPQGLRCSQGPGLSPMVGHRKTTASKNAAGVDYTQSKSFSIGEDSDLPMDVITMASWTPPLWSTKWCQRPVSERPVSGFGREITARWSSIKG